MLNYSKMEEQPELLDLFCGAGGAAMGYHRAGFRVTSVDLKKRPNYPFNFIQGDAIEYLKQHGWKYQVIHGSPPCQGYSAHTKDNSQFVGYSKGKQEPKLIYAMRENIPDGVTYVIENVMGAKDELVNPIMLCGSMFGLPISRHRLFESNELIMVPPHPKCNGIAKRYSELHGIDYRDMSVTGKGRRAGTSQRWMEIMDITWPMTQSEIVESIPHAYTKLIGEQIISNL